jgi:Domain of unknown function (DUF4440)
MQISNVARNYQAGLAISLVVPAFAQEKETVDPKILEQLAALGEEIHEAWSKNDAAALAATYTEDAVLVHDTGPVYGRKAIEKHLNGSSFNRHPGPKACVRNGNRLWYARRLWHPSTSW